MYISASSICFFGGRVGFLGVGVVLTAYGVISVTLC